MVFGLLLKHTSPGYSKIFNEILHSQFRLVFVLAILVVLQIATGED